MTRKFRTLLQSSLLVCISAYHINCLATSIEPSNETYFDNNFSIGADFGWGTIDSPTSRAKRVLEGFGLDLLEATTGSHTWGMRIAYIKSYNEHYSYGAEIGYDDFGNSQITYSDHNQYSFSEQSYNLLAVAKYSIDHKWGLIGKAGLAYAMEQYQNNVLAALTPDYYSVKRKVLPIVKAELTLQVSKKVQLTANYTHLFGDNQKYVSDAFGKLDPSIGPDVLSTVASASSVNIGVNLSI